MDQNKILIIVIGAIIAVILFWVLYLKHKEPKKK